MASARRTKKLNKPKPQALQEIPIPSHFICPISLDLMKDPVTVPTGITYDRPSIEAWLDAGNSTCPVTKHHLAADEAIPNHSLRRLIQDWCVANRSHGIERIPTPRAPITAAQASLILSEISANGAGARALVARVGKLAKESERDRRCLQRAGAARVLASLFSDSACVVASEEILSAITCFLPLDRDACLYLGSRGSLESIASIMRAGDLASRLNAVATIKQVVSVGKDVARVVGDTDGLTEALIELIREPISPRATRASLSACFFMISYGEASATKFVELGVVPLIIELLIDSDKGTCEKALAVLDAVCGSEGGREAAGGHALAVPVLVKKMFRVSDLATELVVSALWKLRKEEGVLLEAIQVGAFQKVLLLLQVGCSDGVKEKATELLKLMNGSREKLDCVDVVDFKGLKRSF